jgi:1,4-alpha-glucan branching enzyme
MFMGGEIAQEHEWCHDGEIEWYRLDDPDHRGVQRLVGDLNQVYAREPALHRHDTEARGFRWLIGDDRANSVFAFLRQTDGDAAPILAVCNMTPTVRHDYRIGAPRAGQWREIFNSDSALYGGSNQGNSGAVHTSEVAAHGEPQSLSLVLPPLATLFLRYDG